MSEKEVKQIIVSGAVILRENNGVKEIFATQRGYGDWKGWWEIPGGKLEPGETPQQCIIREIREELATEVKAEKILGVVDYDYPAFHLTMHCFLCHLAEGVLELREHTSAIWLDSAHLNDIQWLPADFGVLPLIRDAVQQKRTDSDNNLTINTLNAR